MKKLIVVVVVTATAFLYGVGVGTDQVFPYYQLRHAKRLILDQGAAFRGDVWLAEFCAKHKIKHAFFSQLASKGNSENIFLGDSAVELLRSENFFSIAYSKMASTGNIVECMDLIGDEILALNTKNIIIYLGGNDADGGGRQTVEEVPLSYRNFVVRLREHGTNVVIHAIHRGTPSRRDQDFVNQLNLELKQIASDTNSHFIETYDLLDFSSEGDTFDELSYDGEHLKALGYYNWLQYINENLPDEMPPLFRN